MFKLKENESITIYFTKKLKILIFKKKYITYIIKFKKKNSHLIILLQIMIIIF